MRIVTILGLGVLGLFFALPAQALTISNTDPDPHTITVKTASDSKELTIEPEAAVEPPCDSGCTVELENGEQYEMKGNEEVSIEGGTIFVDAAPGAAGDDDNAAAGADPDQPSDAEPQDSAADHSKAGAQ
jgi:hypothetical protein